MKIITIIILGIVTLAAVFPKGANGEEFDREQALEDFRETGDWKLLPNLKSSLRPIDSWIEAEFAADVSAAITEQEAHLIKEMEPVKETIDAFMLEMRQRTDQPFITPGTTSPEDVPDLEYRKRFVEFLNAMDTDKKVAEKRGIYSDFKSGG